MKLYSILFFVILNSCVTGKIAVKTGITEISFGNGGGFTGKVKTHKLTADTKLFEENKKSTNIDYAQTLKIFKEAGLLKDYSFNKPSNVYSFIQIKTKDKTNRIVWRSGSQKVDKKATELHKKLTNLVK